jgi:DNA-binding transcriptional ArsR family regulator
VNRGAIFNYMVEQNNPHLDLVFRALGDSTRRGMLASLALGEKSISELAGPFAMSFAGASKHVKVLEEAGLVRREVRGRTHICRLEAGPMASADQWLREYERFWTGRLDVLEQLLRNDVLNKARSRKQGEMK